MIVKMTILSLLGSSDDKEKIGVARPEGPHLRWFRPSRVSGQRPETSSVQRTKNWRDREETKSKKSRQRYFSITGWTGAEKITYVGALTWSTPGSLVSPVEPMLGKLRTSVQWTQKLRQGLYTGWTDDWVLVNVGAVVQRVGFRKLWDSYMHRLNRRWRYIHRLIMSVD